MFQVCSDLHLEFLNKPKTHFPTLIKPEGKYLILAGDTCPFHDMQRIIGFLKYYSKKFKKIFWVHGNHEFYTYKNKTEKTMEKLKEQFLAMLVKEKIENVVVLDNAVHEVEDVTLIGSTLWSHIPTRDSMNAIKNMNDYRAISVVNENNEQHGKWLTTSKVNKLHSQAVEFLKTEIEKTEKKNVIVITHHAPLTEGTHNYDENWQKSAYCTDLSELFKPNVGVWIFGHTHYPCDFKFNETRVISNPRGYNLENKFNPSCVLGCTD